MDFKKIKALLILIEWSGKKVTIEKEINNHHLVFSINFDTTFMKMTKYFSVVIADGFYATEDTKTNISDDDYSHSYLKLEEFEERLSSFQTDNINGKLSYKELLRQRNEMFLAMQEFVDRVDKGEVKSKKTYSKFKTIIENLNLFNK